MPDHRLKKARESLPSGYQYCDAAPWEVRADRDFAALQRQQHAIGEPIRIRLGKSYDVRVSDEMQQRWRDEFHAPAGAQLGRPISCR